MTSITSEELEEIREMVEAEFPNDPALQQIHIARKIIAKEAEHEGLSYLEYIKSINSIYSKPFYSNMETKHMTAEYESLALKYAPELYYEESRNPFQNINPEDMGGLYWHVVERPARGKDVCIQYIAYFKYQHWVPGIFDRFSGKLPGEHPNDYVPIFLYIRNEKPVEVIFDICHYEAIGAFTASSPFFSEGKGPRFHVRNFYRGLLPLKSTGGYNLLRAVPTPLYSDRLTQWWKGMTSMGSYHEKAKLIINNKIRNPFQEITTFRDKEGKLGVLFDFIFRSKLDQMTIRGKPQKQAETVSPDKKKIEKEFSQQEIKETSQFLEKNILSGLELPDYLVLRGYKKFQMV